MAPPAAKDTETCNRFFFIAPELMSGLPRAEERERVGVGTAVHGVGTMASAGDGRLASGAGAEGIPRRAAPKTSYRQSVWRRQQRRTAVLRAPMSWKTQAG